MNNPEEHTKLDQYLERLMKKQDEIDEKAKNAQIYRDYNEYFTYEQGIVRTVTEDSDTISGSGSSVIMNRSNGATINGK